jgi:hypothetical protein
VLVDCASDDWRPILDRGTWDRVQKVLSDPARRTSPGSWRRWWLSGIAVCGRCENSVKMRTASHPKGPRYTCVECEMSIEAKRTDELLEDALLALLDRDAWRRLRQGQPVGPDTTGFEVAMNDLTARFMAGDFDGAEMGRLADALRQEVTAAPRPSLPDVDDLRKAWPDLDVDQRRLVFTAATQSLQILPWRHRNGFDCMRVRWTPVD